MRYSFDNCLLDVEAMELRVDGQPVPVQPQVMDVLLVLIDERDRVVSKQELLERVWGHTFVTESALTSRIKSLRRAIGDDGKSQRLIRTVHGRGYRFVGDVEELRADVPATAGTIGHRLPRYGSKLIGRDSSVAAVEELLRQSRLVTIVGPGGVGKTRLAIAVAERSEVPAAFVDLAAISDPALVTSHIASTIGLHPAKSLPDQGLVEYLAGRPIRLILDNAEHVIDASAEIGELVHSVAELEVIVTSRERLRVLGEQVYQLEPLALDGSPEQSDDVSSAVALFTQQARAVDPGFELDRFRSSVEKICRAVDGLPLAIELAAAQTGTLPPDMLAARLAERLRSASGSRRDAPVRQRTMADTIDWSLQLLRLDELRLFVRLGVFAGDVPIEAVEEVCRDGDLDDPVDALLRLVDRSLVRRSTLGTGAVRYGMLELLRQRAAELLRDDPVEPALQRRYCGFVAERLQRIDEERRAGYATTWIERQASLRIESRRAFAVAVSLADWETAARIAGSLAMYFHREGGFDEGRRWLELLVQHHDELSDDALAGVLFADGLLAWDDNDLSSARSAWSEAVVVLDRLSDDGRGAWVLASLAMTYLDDPEERDAGHRLLERGVEMARRSGAPLVLAEVLNIGGEFARSIGDDTAAKRRYDESLAIAHDHGDLVLESIAMANLSYLACHQGDFVEGRRLGRRALEMCWSLQRRQLAAWSVSELAGPAVGLGEYELAARLIGGAERALELLGGRIFPADLAEHDRVVETLVGSIGAERLAELREQGRQLSLDESVALALGV